MRTWAICRRSKPAGFTLLEILVVLAIVGLLAGVTLPHMSKMAERSQMAAQRQAILIEIEGLGYRAYSDGRPITITQLKAGLAGQPFNLPEGWQVLAEKPITYAINGVCSGGVLALISPDSQTEKLRLKSPLCRIEAFDA